MCAVPSHPIPWDDFHGNPLPMDKSGDWFLKVNDFGGLIDRMIKCKILSQLEFS